MTAQALMEFYSSDKHTLAAVSDEVKRRRLPMPQNWSGMVSVLAEDDVGQQPEKKK
jgi:hypothetical protein